MLLMIRVRLQIPHRWVEALWRSGGCCGLGRVGDTSGYCAPFGMKIRIDYLFNLTGRGT